MSRKVALITGASSGIGAATARLAAQRGYDIGLGFHSDKSAAKTLQNELQDIGARVTLLQGDVSQEADIKRIFEKCDTDLGPLTALVNNAGIVDETCRIEEMTRTRLMRMFEVNVIGALQCAGEAVRRMAHRYGGAGGAIVNLSSVAAKNGSAHQYADYAASKCAIDSLTRDLAIENAQEGIRVNAVRPGIISTPIHAKGGQPGREIKLAHIIPMQRPGTAEEIAQCILFLMSDEASYITGSILDVSGGR